MVASYASCWQLRMEWTSWPFAGKCKLFVIYYGILMYIALVVVISLMRHSVWHTTWLLCSLFQTFCNQHTEIRCIQEGGILPQWISCDAFGYSVLLPVFFLSLASIPQQTNGGSSEKSCAEANPGFFHRWCCRARSVSWYRSCDPWRCNCTCLACFFPVQFWDGHADLPIHVFFFFRMASLTFGTCDACVSIISITPRIVSLGGPPKGPGVDVCSKSQQAINQALEKSPDARMVCISSIGVGDHYQHCSLFAKFFASWIIPEALADKHLQEEMVRKLKNWVVVRPGGLIDAPAKGYWHAAEDACGFYPTIPRADVASFVVNECLPPQSSWLRRNVALVHS